jgi:cytochrome c oxidase subunit 1
MSAAAIPNNTILNLPDPSTAMMPKRNYLNNEDGMLSWLLTGDHKRIAMLYLYSITFFFFIGGAFAGLIRLELLTPQPDLVASDTYNKFFTMHGIIMIFLFLVPSVPATLGNFLIPIMIGAKDLAFPKINLLSWYLYLTGGTFTLAALVLGGVDTGWTFTTPLSTHYLNTHVLTAATAIFIAGFSSIFTGLNFIVTIHRMRAPGMTWFRMPLFVWSHYAASVLMVLGTPVLAIALVLVALERLIGIGVFDPSKGGDPLLFQHLFWFYSHPAVYIMILPGMGVISEVISTFSRKRVFGYTAVAFSSVAIAVFGFFVWAHHMFIMGVSNYSALVFSLLTMLVAVPSAIKIFNWAFTLQKGSITFETPMLYAFGFMGLFTIGGLTGVFLGALGMDIHLTETYFIVAHFHYVMVGGMLMAFLAGIHFWWPKMTGRMYSEPLSKLAAVVSFIGFNLTFMPQFILGYLGMPRRYHAYPAEYQVLNVLSTAGATVLGVGFTLPLLYLGWSLKYGAIAGNNPWQATGLEWQIQSPPLTENFTEIPVVDHEAYDYEWLEKKTANEVTTVRSDPRARGGARSRRPPRCAAATPPPLRDGRAAARGRQLRHVALPADGDHVLRRDVLRLSALSQLVLRRFRGGVQPAQHHSRYRQYHHPDHLGLLHGAGGLGCGGPQPEASRDLSLAYHHLRDRFPRGQGGRIPREVGETSHPGRELQRQGI